MKLKVMNAVPFGEMELTKNVKDLKSNIEGGRDQMSLRKSLTNPIFHLERHLLLAPSRCNMIIVYCVQVKELWKETGI